MVDQEKADDTHTVFRQRSSFIGKNQGCRTKGFHSFEAVHQRIAIRHAPDAPGERKGGNNGQAFRHGGHGKGFDAEALSTGMTRTNGFGLHDVRARVDALDGEVNIASTPGEGARVEIRLPLARSREETKEKTE